VRAVSEFPTTFIEEFRTMRKLFLSLACLALVSSPAFAGKYNTTVSVGEKAPAFEGIPAVKGEKTTALTLADVKEDVVVLVFLANHCPVVVDYEDRIIDFAKKFEGKNVKVLAVCCSGPSQKQADDLDAIKVKVKDKGYNFAYGYDESQKIGKAYGASATPQFFVLDKERKIRYMGAMDDNTRDEAKVKKHYLADAVNAVLANETVEITETKAIGCGINYKN